MRVLHIIDLRDGSDEARTACRAAVAIEAARHRVIGLGSSSDASRARAAGVPLDAFAPWVGPAPELSCRRLRRLINDRNPRDARRPWADVVQCWSPELLGLTRLASGQRTPPRVGALLRTPLHPPAGLHRIRLDYGFWSATMFSFDRFVRASWAEPVSTRRGGTRLEQDIRLLTAPRESISAEDAADARTAARAEFGLGADDVAVALLADPPRAADAAAFAFVLGLLFTTGARVVGLTRHGSLNHRRAARFVRLHGRRWGLTPDSPRFADGAMFAAADVAVWMAGTENCGAPATGAISIARALALGVPVVASRHPISVEALGPLASPALPLLARDTTLNALADRLLPLVGDAALRAAAARACRDHAQAAAPRQFEDELLRLWQEVTNTPVIRLGLPTPLAMLEGAA